MSISDDDVWVHFLRSKLLVTARKTHDLKTPRVNIMMDDDVDTVVHKHNSDKH